MYWWSYPSKVTLFVLLPVYVSCCAIGSEGFRLYGHYTKFIDFNVFLVGLTGLLVFGFSSWLLEGKGDRPANLDRINPVVLGRALLAMFCLSVAGYVMFFLPLLGRPSLIPELAFGSNSAQFQIRALLTVDKLHGTSLMSLQMYVAILYGLWRQLSDKPPTRSARIQFYVLLVMCLLRAWLNSERLAAIELVLPFALVRYAGIQNRKSVALVFAPLFGVVAVYFLFSVGEYFRSWQFYRAFGGTFVEFSWARLVGYYATALNNGAAAITRLPPNVWPLRTFPFLFKLPFWNALGLPNPLESDQWMTFLALYANPEFNNPSGIFSPVSDFGLVLGIGTWALMGVIAGSLFRAYYRWKLVGLILYPAFYIGIAEVLRIFYWGLDRTFLPIVGGFLLVFYLNARRPSAWSEALAAENG